ncbi:MAG: GAF domain-containing protein [Anaerolineae bacterium]|nr:GAF domain-containing protein [Anaerolineae bacterium]
MLEDVEAGSAGRKADRSPAPSSCGPAENDSAAVHRQIAGLRAELDATNARWAALYRTAVIFTGRAFASVILDQIVRSSMELVQAEQGVLLEYSPATDDLVIRAALSVHGEPPLPVGRRVKPGEGLTGLAWQTGRVQIVDEYHRWPGRLPEARAEHTHTAIAVPLIGHRGAVGALGMASEQEGRRFSAQDIEMLQLFAQQATAILDANAGRRLLQELAVRAERRRLAQRLHDDMQQRLAGLLLKIDRCQSQLKADQAALYDELEAVAGQIYELLTELRSVASFLHETAPGGRNLAEALYSLASQTAAETGLHIHVDAADLPTLHLPDTLATIALRVVREGLINAWRHGRATEATVRFEHLPDGRSRISVTDNGCGIVPPPLDDSMASGGFGLTSLRQQIEAAGGHFGLDTALNCGAELWAVFPCAEAQDAHPNTDRR